MSNDSANIVSVSASLQPSSATLGDLLTLSIDVTHDPRGQMEPVALPKSVGTFEVYASTQPTPDHFQALLQNFATGQQTLAPIELFYLDPAGHRHSLKTSSVTVAITEVPSGPKDKGDIRGIKGVIGPVAWSSWWWLLAVIAILGTAYWSWKHHENIVQGPPPPPPIPPDVLALEQLQDLLADGGPDPEQLKIFYSRLSDILRTYIEQGFHCPALERTTNELLRDVRKRAVFDSESLLALKELLESGDLVKFAKFRPEVDEALRDHALAVKVVEKTRHHLKEADHAPR